MNYGLLIISSSQKGREVLSSLTDNEKFNPVHTANSIAEAKKMLTESKYDIIIVDTPLSDGGGINFAFELSRNLSYGIMLLTNSNKTRKIETEVENHGIITVEKPIDRAMFSRIMTVLTQMVMRYHIMEEQNQKLKGKLTEVKLTERAKNILMQCLKMTEQQAHKYIEKTAMDMQISKKEVAVSIINTYTDTY